MSSFQGAAIPGGAKAAVAGEAAAQAPAAATAAAPAAAKQAAQSSVIVPATIPVTQQETADPTAPAPSTPAILQSGLGLGNDKKFILLREPEAEAEPGLAEAVQMLKRDVAALKEGRQVESTLTARDPAGFQAALNFATAAMKISPPVELGTGEKGSGVGIKIGSGASGSVAGVTAKPARRGLSGATAIKIISKREIPEHV